jgi:uncharacterized tellurite resistance protein B-like protein
MNNDPRFTIEAVRPLVTQENAQGRYLLVTFTCPASRRPVSGRWTAPDSWGRDVTSKVAAQAKQTAWYEVRRQAHSLLHSVLGGGLGRIAGSALDSAFYATQPSTSSASSPAASLSGAAREQAIVEAFRGVAAEFSWVSGKWVHKSAASSLLSPFERELHDKPFGGYEKQVAARLCLEIAKSSGGISEEERSHLEDALGQVGADPGSLAALAQRPPLSKAELGEVSAANKLGLMALGWTIAYADEAFDEAEQARLDSVADGLGLSAADRLKARDLARGWLLDQWFERAFAWGGHDVHLREQAVAMGTKIGMSRDEVEAAEASYQRRRAS